MDIGVLQERISLWKKCTNDYWIFNKTNIQIILNTHGEHVAFLKTKGNISKMSELKNKNIKTSREFHEIRKLKFNTYS